ncbi:MAG: PEGA domain-containing protein [Deltaproteobacteria bacterium]|nr:PEGA domain-containing protein [Deltaproteobacteria bacterium]
MVKNDVFRGLWWTSMALVLASSAFAEPKPDPKRVRKAALVPVVLGDDRGDAHLSVMNAKVGDAFKQRLGVRLVSSEELFVVHGTISNAVQSCGADTRCTSAELRKVGADLGLVAVVNLVVDPPLIALRLVDAKTETVIGSATDSSRIGAEAVGESLRQRASQLLDDAGFGLGARVVFETIPPGAHVEVQGFDADAGAPNVFFVPPGTYRVKASQEGYTALETELTAAPGETIHRALELSEDASLVQSPWFWAGIGVVVAGAVTTAIILAQPGDRCICVALPGAPCPPC